MATYRAEIAARYVPMLYPFIGDKEARFYLSGLLIEPRPEGGAFLVATNRYVMAIVLDETATAASAEIWPIERQVHRLARKGPIGTRVAFTGRHAEVLTKHGGVAYAAALSVPIDAKFPDWRRVIPKEAGASAGVICANLRYVAGFAAAAAEKPIWMFGDGRDDTPVIVRAAATPEFLGLLMAMESSVVMTPFPDWLAERPAAPSPEAA